MPPSQTTVALWPIHHRPGGETPGNFAVLAVNAWRDAITLLTPAFPLIGVFQPRGGRVRLYCPAVVALSEEGVCVMGHIVAHLAPPTRPEVNGRVTVVLDEVGGSLPFPYEISRDPVGILPLREDFIVILRGDHYDLRHVFHLLSAPSDSLGTLLRQSGRSGAGEDGSTEQWTPVARRPARRRRAPVAKLFFPCGKQRMSDHSIAGRKVFCLYRHPTRVAQPRPKYVILNPCPCRLRCSLVFGRSQPPTLIWRATNLTLLPNFSSMAP